MGFRSKKGRGRKRKTTTPIGNIAAQRKRKKALNDAQYKHRKSKKRKLSELNFFKKFLLQLMALKKSVAGRLVFYPPANALRKTGTIPPFYFIRTAKSQIGNVRLILQSVPFSSLYSMISKWKTQMLKYFVKAILMVPLVQLSVLPQQ